MLYDEINRLRRRDGLSEADPLEFARKLEHHFVKADVPRVAEAIRNIEQEHGITFQSPKRKGPVRSFFERMMPLAEAFSRADE